MPGELIPLFSVFSLDSDQLGVFILFTFISLELGMMPDK